MKQFYEWILLVLAVGTDQGNFTSIRSFSSVSLRFKATMKVLTWGYLSAMASSSDLFKSYWRLTNTWKFTKQSNNTVPPWEYFLSLMYLCKLSNYYSHITAFCFFSTRWKLFECMLQMLSSFWHWYTQLCYTKLVFNQKLKCICTYILLLCAALTISDKYHTITFLTFYAFCVFVIRCSKTYTAHVCYHGQVY